MANGGEKKFMNSENLIYTLQQLKNKFVSREYVDGAIQALETNKYALKTDLHEHTNKTTLDTITNEHIVAWNHAISLDDTYTADANAWLTNGYVKTSTSTQNLPSVCTGSDRWGVLFFIAENAANGTGTQTYYPIDGAYVGRVFTRSILNRSPRGDWQLLSTFDGDYHSLTNRPTIPSMDGYATEDYVQEQLGGYKIVKMTQAEYNALNTKDANTLYLII